MDSIATVPVTDPRSSAMGRTAEVPVSFADMTAEEDAARARIYALLSNLLVRPADADALATLGAIARPPAMESCHPGRPRCES